MIAAVMPSTQHVVLCVALSVAAPILSTPRAVADPLIDLRSHVDAARIAARCPVLQSDPNLNRVSQDTSREIADYVRHATSFMPPATDKDMQQVLRDAGYSTIKVRMLMGYGDNRTGGPGDNASKAIKAAVIEGEGYESFSDCGYTKYGLGMASDDGSQGWPSGAPRAYAVATVVLSGD